MVLKPGTGSFGTVCRCQVLLENEICISINLWSAAGSMKCSKTSWYTAVLTLDLRKHSGPTPADDMAPQTITDCGNFFSQFVSQSSPGCGYAYCLYTFFLPHLFLPFASLLMCLDTELCEQPASFAMTFCVLPSLCKVSMVVFWTTVKSAVFPVIV